MKKIIAIVAFAWLSFFTFICMADDWCVLCLKGQNVKAVKEETPRTPPASVAEVPDKPECKCRLHELLPLLKNASCDATFGIRSMKEPMKIAHFEDGENIPYNLDINDNVTIFLRKGKEDIPPTWTVQANDKSFGVSIDDLISILKASEEK